MSRAAAARHAALTSWLQAGGSSGGPVLPCQLHNWNVHGER
jgi:hypothetical protein